jgi:hypothetical protein
LAMRLKPKTRAMKKTTETFGGTTPLISSVVAGALLAIWVPENEKKRNRKVPTNSPRPATTLLRTVEGSESMGRRVVAILWSLGPASEAKVDILTGWQSKRPVLLVEELTMECG